MDIVWSTARHLSESGRSLSFRGTNDITQVKSKKDNLWSKRMANRTFCGSERFAKVNGPQINKTDGEKGQN